MGKRGVTRDLTWRPTRHRQSGHIRTRTWLVLAAALIAVNLAVILYHGDPRTQLPKATPASAPPRVEPPPAPRRDAAPAARALGAEVGTAIDATAGMRTAALVQRVAVQELDRGETVAHALTAAGAGGGEIDGALRSLSALVDFRRLLPGSVLKARFDGDGRLLSVDVHQSGLERARVSRRGDGWEARKLDLHVDGVEAQVSGEVRTSLWESLVGGGERPRLVTEIVDIFGWEIDFYRDLSTGDTYRLLVEKKYVDGEFVGYGPVYAAEFVTAGTAHRAFRFAREDGGVAYYDEQGQSMRKQLLKSPLEYGRMTSGFGKRQHPILGYSRAHNGVDYGVPTGTPVWSVGDGLVVRAGWTDGFGKIVEVRHANNWVSQYAHLSAILVRAGQRVFQKDVIGKVGSTGLSTGPHLHYGLKLNQTYVNPATQSFERGKPLAGADLERFRADVAAWRAKLEQIRIAATALAAEEG
jgi:murein DD-endopeptidase MepM/ murein hydrolase activator NlpD